MWGRLIPQDSAYLGTHLCRAASIEHTTSHSSSSAALDRSAYQVSGPELA